MKKSSSLYSSCIAFLFCYIRYSFKRTNKHHFQLCARKRHVYAYPIISSLLGDQRNLGSWTVAVCAFLIVLVRPSGWNHRYMQLLRTSRPYKSYTVNRVVWQKQTSLCRIFSSACISRTHSYSIVHLQFPQSYLICIQTLVFQRMQILQ